MKTLPIVLLVFMFTSCMTAQNSSNELHFDAPAKAWNEAIPIGNGSLGGMVYGGIDIDTIKINEETLWSGGPRDLQNYEAINHLPKIRKLLMEGKTRKAEKLIDNTMLGEYNECYMPMGDLVIKTESKGKASAYRRFLDLSTGLVNIEYEIDDVKYEKEIFAV